MRHPTTIAALAAIYLLLTIAPLPLFGQQASEAIRWHDDYGVAYAVALRDGKMLLVYFRDEADAACRRFDEDTLADELVQQLLGQFVLLRVPTSADVTAGGDDVALLKHDAFAHMHGGAGLAVIDLKHTGRSCYRHTVSSLPFAQPKYYAPRYESPQSLKTLLRLPAGTLTQRTMIYAVRLHPEKPASTGARADEYLLTACESHSRYQASINLQGHHNWDARFQRISAKMGGNAASEVCAESWPGERLVDACFSCVHSWRQSPGHWSAVSSPQPAYGYDIKLGSGGTWYATGIFAGK